MELILNITNNGNVVDTADLIVDKDSCVIDIVDTLKRLISDATDQSQRQCIVTSKTLGRGLTVKERENIRQRTLILERKIKGKNPIASFITLEIQRCILWELLVDETANNIFNYANEKRKMPVLVVESMIFNEIV